MANKKIIQRETALMREAYEYYYSLGDDRKLGTISERFGRSKRTVELWSTSFGWPGRVAQKDREISAEMERRSFKDLVESKLQYLKLVKLAMRRYLDALMETNEDGKPILRITTVSDFEKLIKVHLLLAGDFTSVSKVQADIATLSEADRAALNDLKNAIMRDIKLASKTRVDQT